MTEKEIRLIDDNAFIPYIITCAKSGCKQSARTLMQYTAEYLSEGGTIPDNLRRYLSEAFNHVLQGESADKALYLRHRRGKNDTALYKKQAIAHEVSRLYWIGEAITIDDACKTVSKNGVKKLHLDDGKLIFVDEKTAYKYYYEINPGTPERRPVI